MCGIFGIVSNNELKPSEIRTIIKDLFVLSESRGREASGIAIRDNERIRVLKQPVTASKFIKSKEYDQLLTKLDDVSGRGISLIGHCRLATNGKQEYNLNNHPVVKGGAVGVHDGIIVNFESLYDNFDYLNRDSEVDTELFLDLMQHFRQMGKDIPDSVGEAYSSIYGETSVAVLFDDLSDLLLATNTGSIHYANRESLTIFASESYILKSLLGKHRNLGLSSGDVVQLKPGSGVVVSDDSVHGYSLNAPSVKIDYNRNIVEIVDYSKNNVIRSKPRLYNRDRLMEKIMSQPDPDDHITRCTKCLLPDTFPFIEFDEEGVCNYCRNHTPYEVKGEDELRKLVEPYRSKNCEPDCLVGFSGGRDSCYMLHYLKKELGMNPIAFTYDWGMVTDLARRNQARLCGKLGIEHIWISADIHKKRENIRKNIKAWLKKPELGMVPLLMAGDKQFYYYAHKVMKQTGVKLIFSGANYFEKTDFKTGFCGIREGETIDKGLLTGISLFNKLKLFWYYGYQFLTNPSYLNSSLLDTLHAFYCSYILPDAYTYFYNYIRWNEEKIMNVLKNEYEWETAEDTEATWRIGDGTAAFYNYIYYNLAGFSEFDTFRSNQIREGLISRNEALKRVKTENLSRYDSLKWYADIVGFDLEHALDIIHNMPKIWDKID